MNRWTLGVAAVAASLAFSSVSLAAFTGIGRPAPGELTHKQIFAQAYGGSFRYAGANLTNGSVTAVRVSDDADQAFAAGSYNVRTVANYGGGPASFGYRQNGQYQEMLSTPARGMIGDAASATGSFSEPVEFALGVGTGHFSTTTASNADLYDHAITYKLTGLDFGGDVFVVFFENRMRWRSDRDFNDLVVEVASISHAPTPAAAAMGLSLLAAIGMRRRRSDA